MRRMALAVGGRVLNLRGEVAVGEGVDEPLDRGLEGD